MPATEKNVHFNKEKEKEREKKEKKIYDKSIIVNHKQKKNLDRKYLNATNDKLKSIKL